MARILYAWEIGSGLGHLASMLPTASRLQAAGHQVHLAIRHLNHAEAFFGPAGLAFSQAPIWLGEAVGVNPASYAEMLLDCGYGSVDGLLGLLRAWRQLFTFYQPDLLVADHAPTALLAARGLGVRTALIGSGFFSPPRVSPMPVFRTWELVDVQRVARHEQQIVETINATLAKLGVPLIKVLADVFTSLDADLLCTWPELDAYPQRGSADHMGPLFARDEGTAPVWPARSGKRLLLYLKKQYPHLPALLQGLQESRFQGAAYVMGNLPPPLRQARPTNIQLLNKPIHLRDALAEADAMVCHAGQGTIAATLLAGKPLLLLPMVAEQFINAQCASRLGAALTVVPELKPVSWAGALREIVNQQDYTNQARAFAAKYADFNSEQQAQEMAKRLVALL